MKSKKAIILFVSLIMLAGLSGMGIVKHKENQKKKYHYFENPQACSGCHVEKFDRWNTSQHSKAFTGDFFQAQFYDVVLPSRSFDEKVANVEQDCIGCHSPSAFLSDDMIPPRSADADNFWNRGDGYKLDADRGVFCDFCHTLDHFENDPPFNHDYISHATEEIDTKKADLEFPWSPHHETETSEIYETEHICATCHNELNPYDVWVKATQLEYAESIYPSRGIVCQTCHMQPMAGKPAKMGIPRDIATDHWWGGGFAGFVEGAAIVEFEDEFEAINKGDQIDFNLIVEAVATGHNFPTGSVEERDVWLHVSLNDLDGKEVLHIPVNIDQNNPNEKYFVTSNARVAYPSHSKLSEPLERDGLVEGDRLYHSAFLDSDGEFTYAQWFCVEEIENRLRPLVERTESYSLSVPSNIDKGDYNLTAVLYFRRMPDPLADFLKVDRRPIVEVSRDQRKISIR